MIASLMAIGAAPASAAADTSATCPSSTPSAGFTDIGAYPESTQLAINCVADYGIANGTTATTYSPEGEVTRWQMALFLTRAAVDHGLTLGDGSSQGFTDIGDYPASTQTAINQLAQLDITKGTTTTTFSPHAPVPRWQMALFITRLLDAAGYTLGDGSSQGFTDISDYPTSTQTAINQVAQAGVAEGFTATTVGPGQNTTRVQMAIFITRELAADGIVLVNQGNEDFTLTPSGAEILAVSTAVGTTNANRGLRAYTASGLTAGTSYRVELIPADEVSVDANGVVTFGDNEGTAGQADDLGNTSGRIEVINRVATDNSDSQAASADAKGEISFSVDSETENIEVIPVVYLDADSDGELDLNATGQPTEPFTTGGATQWIPAEFAGGSPAGDE